MLRFKKVSAQREEQICGELEDAARLHTPFFILVAMSAVMATFGLLLNSPAIIIGAMLVAPLMTPIFSLSLGLLRGEARLLRRSLLTEAYGVGLAILVALLVGLIVPEPELTHEILSRTQPTLFDLAVALAAGVAGAFALVREEVSPALPGVAIAVSLLPPLGVVGIGLSLRRMDVAGGALLLFLANFVAIHLVSGAVFHASGLAPRIVERNPSMLVKRFGFTAILLLLMGLFLGQQLLGLVRHHRDTKMVRGLLEQQVKMIQGASLAGVDLSCRSDFCQVTAEVRTPQRFEPPVVNAIQNLLEDGMGRRVELYVRSVLVSEASAAGYRYVIEPKPDEKKEPEKPRPSLPAERARQILATQEKMVPGAKLVDLRVVPGTQPLAVDATYLVEKPFDASLEQGIRNLLQAELGQEVELVIRYVGPLPPRGEKQDEKTRRPSASP